MGGRGTGTATPAPAATWRVGTTATRSPRSSSRSGTGASGIPPRPELERYFNYVTDRFDLRRDIRFGTRVERARFDGGRNRWVIDTSDGATVSARYLVSAAGCLSEVNKPPIPGAETFAGTQHHTARWPAEGVDVGGKRVGVIGTGSSGVQVIPQVARTAEHVHVFQRTAPIHRSGTQPPARRRRPQRTQGQLRASGRQLKRTTPAGLSRPTVAVSSVPEMDESTRADILEDSWQRGGPGFAMTFDDILTDPESNERAARFVRRKVRAKVTDPEVARKLVDIDYPIGARRLIVDIDYFETYNRANVTLVDVGAAPITEITPRGLRTSDGHYDLDVLVYATVFRRDDRCAAVDGHLRGRRAGAAGQVGRRGRAPTWAWSHPGSRTCS